MAGTIRNLSDTEVVDDLTVTGKIRGAQATQEGDAIMLGAGAKIPTQFYDQATVDLSQYYTKSEVYTKAEVDGLLGGKLGSDALNGYATTAQVTGLLSGYVPTSRTINGKALSGNITLSAADVGAAVAANWSQQFTGNGTSKTFTYSHNKNTTALVHDLWKYDSTNQRWELYITDISITATQVVIDFYNAPTASDQFIIVLR